MALLASVGALALAAGPAACGSSNPAGKEPVLGKPGKLTVVIIAGPSPAPGPAGFHREVVADIANRLELEAVLVDGSSARAAADLAKHRADAAAPVAAVTPAPGRHVTSAPYFEDPSTRVLYGLGVAPGPDPDKPSPLLEDLDEALSELKDDGTLQKIYDKWFPGTDVPDAVLNDATG
jgi:ABC-type amino acid transport substrate-binding protein